MLKVHVCALCMFACTYMLKCTYAHHTYVNEPTENHRHHRHMQTQTHAHTHT